MKVLIVVALSLLVAVASGKSICAGCPVAMDVSEAEAVLKTAEAKLAASGGRQYRFSTIHSATKQVISGVLYSINVDVIEADNTVETCNVEVIEQPWLDNTQVTVKCPKENQVRSAIVGGAEPMDTEEAESVLKATEAKLATLEDGNHFTFSKIHSATKQIVAGILYSYNVDVVDEVKNVETCDVEIFEQAWLGKTQVTFKCPNEEDIVETYQSNEEQVLTAFVGAAEPMDIEEAESVLKATEAKLATLEDGNHFTFSKIHSATKQIVAGVLYSINVDVMDEVKNVETCDVEIFEQAWLGKTQVTFKCPNEKDIVETYMSKN